MPYKISFTLFIALLCLKLFAQNSQDKGTIFLSLGPSIPLGNYASSSLNNNNAGFASFGGNAKISYSQNFKKYFGGTAEFLGVINPLNLKSMQDAFSQHQFPDISLYSNNGQPQNLPPSEYVSYQNWKFNKKSWMYGAMLLGGFGHFPINKSGAISLTLKASAGAVYLYSPSLHGYGYTDTSMAIVDQSGAKAYGFAYSFGTGIKYSSSKRISYSFEVFYFGTSNVSFKNVSESILMGKGRVIPNLQLISNYMQISEFGNSGTVYQKVSTLNINFGVGMML
jgi:hypothetical protein